MGVPEVNYQEDAGPSDGSAPENAEYDTSNADTLGDTDRVQDAGVNDVLTIPDAENLLINGTFEAPCDGTWVLSPGGASLAADPNEHSGTWACRGCANTTFYIDQTLQGVAAGTYAAEAWVRAPPDADASSGVRLQLGLYFLDGGSDQVSTAILPLTSTYALRTRQVSVPDLKWLEFQVFGSDGCFIVDDAVLSRLP